MQTFSEVINNKYEGLTRGQTQAVNYFEYLAATAGININSESVEDFLDKIKTQKKTDINQYFFKKYDGKKEPVDTMTTVNDISKSFKEFSDAKRKEDIDRLKAQLTNYRSSITKRNHETQRLMGEYSEIRTKYDILTDRKQDWFKIEIEKILGDPFWEYHGKGDDYIDFVTRGSIVLKEPAANFTINFGRFRFRLGLPSFYLRGHKHELNLIYDPESDGSSIIHPYLVDGEEMCYGSGGDNAYRFQQDGELFKLMTLIKNTLTYYNPESRPYVNMTSFKRHLENCTARDKQPEGSPENYFVCDSCGDRHHNERYIGDGLCDNCYSSDEEDSSEEAPF